MNILNCSVLCWTVSIKNRHRKGHEKLIAPFCSAYGVRKQSRCLVLCKCLCDWT